MLASRRQHGFTLVEVVVAFAVFALCAGAVLESFRGAVMRTAQAQRREQALLVGQSVLAQVRATENFTPEQMGETGVGLHWRTDVAPATPEPENANPLVAYRVVVSVFEDDRAEPIVVLRSIELGLAP